MKILCVNAGSSSLKFQVYEMPEEKVLINGYIEKIGAPDCFWTVKVNGEKIKNSRPLKDHTEAASVLIEELLNNKVVESLDEINSLEDSIKELSDFSIEDSISNLDNFSKINIEKFNLALEAMSYLDIDHDLVKEFGQKFSDMEVEKSINSGTLNESYSLLARQEKQVNKLTTEWKTEKDVPLEIRLEAYNYLAAIFESMADDWEDDEEEEDTTSEEEKKPEEKKDEDSNSVKDPYDKHGIQDDPDYKPSRDRGKVSLNGIRLGLEVSRRNSKI